MSLQICVMSLLAHFNPIFWLPVGLKCVCCVRARDVGMIPKIMDNQPMRSISECRVRFGHCFRSFISTAIYKSMSAKIFEISGSVLQVSIHFRSPSTNAVYMPLLPLWVHWYRCFIVYGVTPHRGQRLVFACPRQCIIVMVDRVLLMHFVTKCAMWTVVVSCAHLKDVRSISPQSTVWVRFLLSQCWSSWRLYILYAIDWVMLECILDPCMETLGIPCGSDIPIAIVFLFADKSRNAAIICCASAYSCILRYDSDVRVEARILLFWCPWTCTSNMPDSIDW